MRRAAALQDAHRLALDWERDARSMVVADYVEAEGGMTKCTVDVPGPEGSAPLRAVVTAATQFGALELAHLELRNAAIAYFTAQLMATGYTPSVRGEQLVRDRLVDAGHDAPTDAEIRSAFARARMDHPDVGQLSVGQVADAVLARRQLDRGLPEGQGALL